jgi:diguanylate cyclase (GGDEF)-like protein/PAS domain S-box-containing protein
MRNPDYTDFRLLAEHSADVICRVDMSTIMRYVSPSSLHVLGWTPEEMIGKGPDFLIIPEDLPIIHARSARQYAPGQTDDSPATIRMRRKDGTIIWVETSARRVFDPDTGLPREIVLVMRDITQRKLLEEKLSAQALTDPLTGIANRRAFDQALEKEWKRTLREGSQMSLLLLDVDRFKRFNDQYGHQAGDDCLRAVAAVARAGARRALDIVARYGGEELAFILPCTHAPGALQVAEKIRGAIAELKIPHAGNQDGGGFVTASIGVATAQAHKTETMKMPDSILISADYALYQAKHDGRNRVAATPLMSAQVPARELIA